jgi:hypothetical protein
MNKAIVIENLPCINCKDLGDKRGTYTIDLSFRLPQVPGAKISAGSVTFYHRALHRNTTGDTQSFRLKPIKTGFGGPRYCFICCNCGIAVQTLYYHRGRLACRWCHHALYASQTSSKRQRQVLQIARLESLLNDKAYSRYRSVRARLERKLGMKVMLAKALRR